MALFQPQPDKQQPGKRVPPTYVVQPRPEIFLSVYDEATLKEVISNVERKATARTTLRDLPEWKYVDTKRPPGASVTTRMPKR